MGSLLRTEFHNYMTLRAFSHRTKEAYINAVAGLAKFYMQSPDKLDNRKIQNYLLHLIEERKLAWSSCNVAFSAFRCFYIHILHWDKPNFYLPPRSRQRQLPMLLSAEEVKKLLNAASNCKHRALLMTIYGAGLRVSEAVNLQIHHIESSRHLIRIDQGKGRKDRYTILPEILLQELKFYWQAYHPITWLFPGPNKQKPMSIGTAQKIYYRAKANAGLSKGRGIHTLRHCFATHLADQGTNIFTIKSLLGHTSISTTFKYLHTSSEKIASIKSPLDLLFYSDK